MQISNYNFTKVTGKSFYTGPGIYIYIHQESGKCFVRALRNSRVQRSKNNYPNYLKELLKINASDVLLLFTEISADTKEALHAAATAVTCALSERGILYKRPNSNKVRDYLQPLTHDSVKFTVWSMTHRKTGSVFYFEEVKGNDVADKVVQRLRTFNNYVEKNIVNANRVMFYFVKQHGATKLEDWTVRDLDLAFETEQQALLHITKLSKQHLDNREIVLNKVSGLDSLYYRNSMLGLTPHLSTSEYLQHN